jgi:23S rRNA (uracil1939-C5)-methyltransferase
MLPVSGSVDRPRADLQDRVRCDIARSCGGCALIEHEHAVQLEYKRVVVQQALAAWRELEGVPVEPCLPAPRRTSYRNRASLVVANGKGRVRAGLRRPSGQDLVEIDPCRIQGDPTMALLPRITDWLGRWRLVRPGGLVKLIDLREAADERCHLTLLLECEPERAPELPLEDLVSRTPELCGVAASFNPNPASFGFGRTTRTLWGNATFLAGVPCGSAEPRVFEVAAGGYFHAATAQLPAIHEAMAGHLGAQGVLFDLYCGVGVHGLSLLPPGEGTLLVGVEEDASAAACARRNADRFGVEARYVVRRVEEALPRLVEDTPPARVILNPPRTGCRSAVLKALPPAPGRRLAYLACDAGTLARDLAALVARGWAVTRVLPVDVLPHTARVEVLALLDDHEPGWAGRDLPHLGRAVAARGKRLD